MSITLKNFNKNYIYKRDTENFKKVEHWTILKPNKDGKYIGDCEDYILTLKAKVQGFKNIELYYCKIKNSKGKLEGHCVGVLGDKIIDCNCKKLLNKGQYKRVYSAVGLRKYYKIEIFFKKLQAKFNRFLNRL